MLAFLSYPHQRPLHQHRGAHQQRPELAPRSQPKHHPPTSPVTLTPRVPSIRQTPGCLQGTRLHIYTLKAKHPPD
ncbi:hypothetical protein BDR03DRAFT_953749 [Suillus americanus]|nr:hypothetical protein BDR03DRAFT_953749 [Suillus americanus]